MFYMNEGFMSFLTRKVLPCVTVVALGLTSGCASQKAGLDAPELPARHWLEESPGVPVEHKGKLEASVPSLYNAEKSFSFDDYVYLTIQQSPILVNSAVDIEIKRLDLTSAVWEYLPEPNMTVTVSNNITNYNMSRPDTPANYGRTEFDVGFHASFPNPVETYFTHQARKAMVNLAITTHRKAIGETIGDIASMFHRLEAQRQILDVQKELIPLTAKITKYWKQLETVDGQQGVALELAIQKEREAALKVERTQIENTMMRTKLKILAGVDIGHKLIIDTKNADAIIGDFNGSSLMWEERWKTTEDELLLRAQVELLDYNIMVAWAEYIPDMSFSVNQSPPAGQYQPPAGTDDTFVHFTLNFPLIDWGRRYRGVQSARMEKAKAFQEQVHARTQYSNTWTEAQQNVHLTQTSMKIAETTLEVAKMQEKEASINFKEGISAFPELAARQEALMEARMAYIQAELEYKLAQIQWMHVAGVLKERYIGLPAKEVF